MSALAVGSFVINSIGKLTSSKILTSLKPAFFIASMYSSLLIAPEKAAYISFHRIFTTSGSSFISTISETIILPLVLEPCMPLEKRAFYQAPG